MSKNKQKNQSGSFEVKRKNKFFTKKNLSLALLVFVLATGTFVGIRQKMNKPNVSSAVTGVSDSETPGWWLQKYFGASVCSADNCKQESDPDNDKLSNAQEYFYHSDPLNEDTNKNGLKDGADVANNYDPSRPGKVTFDEVSSEDSILFEGLVFNQDIKKIVEESQDISKVSLPLPLDSDLKISAEDSPEVFQKYFEDLGTAIDKYFSKSNMENMKNTLKSGDTDQIESVKIKSARLVDELKEISVPARLLTFHRYNITFYYLLGEVLPGPDLSSEASSDAWYDKARAFLAIQQKLELEKEILTREASL